VSEVAGLQLDDVILEIQRPHLRLRREITKGHRSRIVPLWWDAATLADLKAWKTERLEQGARGPDPFVCSVQSHRRGQPLQRAALRRRFLTACKVLGLARLRTLTIHHGRHTFISHVCLQPAFIYMWPSTTTVNWAICSLARALVNQVMSEDSLVENRPAKTC
jgi:integrase